MRDEDEFKDMCKFSENEMLSWQDRTGTQPEPAPDLEIRTAPRPGPDAAMLAGVSALNDGAGAVIPIQWMPAHAWRKAIRAVKPSRS